MRKGVVDHVRRLHDIPGLESIALTTNAVLLPKYAEQLREAGLSRVNISLDSMDPDVYARITRGGKLEDALAGLDAAFEYGFAPVKLNVVVVRSLDPDLLGFAKLTIDRPLHVRFIEYMPVGDAEEGSGCHSDIGTVDTEGWTRSDTVPSDEVVSRIAEEGAAAGLGELAAVSRTDAPGGWGPASYYRFPGAPGTVGVISPLSHHFCADCNRLRLTADGRLRPCLFDDHELDVRTRASHRHRRGRARGRPQSARRQARRPRHARRHRSPHVPDRRMTDGRREPRQAHAPRRLRRRADGRRRRQARHPPHRRRGRVRRDGARHTRR